MRKLIFSASPASGLNCGKEKNEDKINVLLPRERDKYITAHTNKCKLITGYGLLCSRLYSLNILNSFSKDKKMKTLSVNQTGLFLLHYLH